MQNKEDSNMAFTNSPLVDMEILSPHFRTRACKITKITVHHAACFPKTKRLAEVFLRKSRQASCNYAIGCDAKIALVVPESKRSLCSSSAWNDNRAITIEVADYLENGVWTTTKEVYNKLIDLLADICMRNNIEELKFTGDRNGSYTWHCFYSNTACPGDFFKENTNNICEEVNRRIKGAASIEKPSVEKPSVEKPVTNNLYRVRKSWNDKASQIGAYKSLDNAKKACTAGYSVFDSNGTVVYSVKEGEKVEPNKTVGRVAQEVLQGKWGNGSERKRRLTQAGYNYNEVQAMVNKLCGK